MIENETARFMEQLTETDGLVNRLANKDGMHDGLAFHEALGEVIREQRLAKRMTLRAVCDKGFVSSGHLSDIENGRKECSSVVISNIANGLGVETYDLIIETGYRMAIARVPEILSNRVDWINQYQDLVG